VTATEIPTGPHPRPRTSPEIGGPVLIGCSGDTLRRRFGKDPSSVPYLYRAGGRRLYVSTPLAHEFTHGTSIPWTECAICWQLGDDSAASGQAAGSLPLRSPPRRSSG